MRSVVLDTHVWFWLINGTGSLSKHSLRAIDRAIVEGSVLIPAISVWELAMLQSRGRIKFGIPLTQWVNEALKGPGVKLVPLSPEIAVESCNLPGTIHGDPSDRIIIATARIHAATLVTRDRLLLDYASSVHVQAITA